MEQLLAMMGGKPIDQLYFSFARSTDNNGRAGSIRSLAEMIEKVTEAEFDRYDRVQAKPSPASADIYIRGREASDRSRKIMGDLQERIAQQPDLQMGLLGGLLKF